MTSNAPPPEVRFPRRGPGRSVRATLGVLFAGTVLLIAGLLAVSWIPVRRARDAYRDGHIVQSIAGAEQWAGFHLWGSQYDQILAAAYLTAGKAAAAEPHLAALRDETLWFSALPKEVVARRLFGRDRYAEFLQYDGACHERKEQAEVALYRAAAQAAVGDFTAATVTIGGLDRAQVDPRKLAALEEALAARKSGSYPLVLDRAGRTIAAYQVANKDLVAVDAQFAPLVEKEAGALTIEAQLARVGTIEPIVTTLDPDVQRAALAALGGFRGALVAIDPRTNEILAIASNRGNGPMANLAIEQQYEPGSVVKVLTGLNALASGVDVKAMFPYDCKGDLMIDGRHFGDWTGPGHGVLPSLDDALAQSCNIVFADLGLRLGADRLRRFMVAAGFDGQTNLGIYDVPLGKLVAPVSSRWETAFLAIGLEHESMNALHVAMLASTMANRGRLVAPRLVQQRRSLLGEAVGNIPKQGSQQLVPEGVASQMIRAMTAVATNEHGTGRRAPVDGVTLALKTGTAGGRNGSGLQALIMAFAPVDRPKIAFGIIAEDAGPAEFAGAKITHDFLEGIRGRL